jgi:hypothetical protein
MVSFEKISAASQANSANSNHRGVDLISDALPFGRLWDAEPNAVTRAQSTTRSFAAAHTMP